MRRLTRLVRRLPLVDAIGGLIARLVRLPRRFYALANQFGAHREEVGEALSVLDARIHALERAGVCGSAPADETHARQPADRSPPGLDNSAIAAQAIEAQTDLGPLLLRPGCSVVTDQITTTGRYEPYEAQRLRSALAPGMTVVAVGANVGYHTVLAAQRVGESGRVLAVEAEPENYELLCANVRLHGLDNVESICAAAADSPGIVQLALSASNSGDHRRSRPCRDPGHARPARPPLVVSIEATVR